MSEGKNLSLQQLRCFAAVAEKGQFRRAAESLGLSQPSLSAQLQNLERTLGLRLINRGKNCSLTPAGRSLLVLSRRVLEGVDEMSSSAQQIRSGEVFDLSVGCSPTVGPYFLPLVARELRRSSSKLKFVAHDGTTDDLVAGCEAGVYDGVVTQLPISNAKLSYSLLFREPLMLAVPRGHRLAFQDDVQFADLSGQEVLTLGSSYALHRLTASICEANGAHLNTTYLGTNLDALQEMTASEMGIAILPAIYAVKQIGDDDPNVKICRIRDRSAWRMIGLAHRRDIRNDAGFRLLEDTIRRVTAQELSDIVVIERKRETA